MELVHVFSIAEMVLGILLLFTAVILWSMSRRFPSSMFAVTALLLYAWIVVDLLDAYGVFDKTSVLVVKGVPILPRVLSIAIVSSFVLTLFVLIGEEKKRR